ncbi:MAG: hypothetical protein JWN04_1490, partial [Myxococcaceae bacterium]|nr:hypothetical protein [Myxococcaceae bacterium]
MRACFVLLLLVLTGCPTNFIEAWEVTEPRLMGVRVEVEGDAGSPRPRLDQTFNLRQYLALPAPLATPLAGRYSLALALCLGFKAPTGAFACFNDQTLAPTLATITDTEILLGDLKADLSQLDLPAGVSFDVSSIPELAAFDRLGLFGGFCIDGTAERVPGKSLTKDAPSELFRCTNYAGAMFPDVT